MLPRAAHNLQRSTTRWRQINITSTPASFPQTRDIVRLARKLDRFDRASRRFFRSGDGATGARRKIDCMPDKGIHIGTVTAQVGQQRIAELTVADQQRLDVARTDQIAHT